ncbi:MAG: hypothetical protein ABSG72_15325 [Candidatus Sulfotelmatobacter sp.]|jgi:hypothetical protein
MADGLMEAGLVTTVLAGALLVYAQVSDHFSDMPDLDVVKLRNIREHLSVVCNPSAVGGSADVETIRTVF